MRLDFLLKNAWMKGWILLVPLALLASLLDGLLLGGVRLYLAFMGDAWPAWLPRLLAEGEGRIALWMALMVLVLALRWLALVVRSRAGERMARSLEAALKGWWIRQVRSLHPRHFHGGETSGLLRSAEQATTLLPQGTEAAVQAVQAVFQLLLFLPVLFWISWPLALALLLGMVPWITWMQRRIQAMGPDLDAHMRRCGAFAADLESWSLLQRSWTGLREQGKYLRRLLGIVRELKELGMHAGVRKALLAQSMESLSVGAVVLVLALCALLISRGDMRPTDLVLFCSALFLCYKPLKECARLAPQLRDMQSAYTALRALEDLERSNSAFVYKDEPSIALYSLDFAYEGGERPVFSGLDKVLELNRPVLLKGANGAGKTSLLRLLCGLELPKAGVVELPASARGGGVFYLSQRLQLPPVAWLAERVEERAWGPSVERLFSVLDLRRLLSKQGHSGGELQRLGLGWAIASGAPLLFLDEPLAFVAQSLRADLMHALLDACVESGQWWMMASHELPPEDVLARMAVWTLDT